MIRKTSALALAAALCVAPALAISAAPAFAAAAAPAPAAAPMTMTPGAIVYDMTGKEIGTIADILTGTHNQSYAVINVQPYLGKPKMILVSVDHIGGTPDHMTMQATKSMIMHMAAIEYNMPSGGH